MYDLSSEMYMKKVMLTVCNLVITCALGRKTYECSV